MNLKTCETWLRNGLRARCLLQDRPPAVPSGPRVLITADIDGPAIYRQLKPLLDFAANLNLPLTLFCTCEMMRETDVPAILRERSDATGGHAVPVEIASHSTTHEALPRKNPARAACIMEESARAFRHKGILVSGFRAPYLSTEGEYREILKELGKAKTSLRYDSSTLFESSLFASRVNDLFPWKAPHRVAGIWELPISCLDDYHLFTKLRQKPDKAQRYWKRKADVCLKRFSYFLLLLHPDVIAPHLPVLEDVIDHCRKAHPAARFVTCSQLVDELDTVSENHDLSLRTEGL